MNMLPQYIFEKNHISYDSLCTPSSLATRASNVALSPSQKPEPSQATPVEDKNPVPANEENEIDTSVYDALKAEENEEKERIIQTLIENKGNVSKSTKILGMHRQSLIYRIKKYGIKVK